MRYERARGADDAAHGRVLTQRHEATAAELAMSEGERPLVGRDEPDAAFTAPEPASVAFM
jgi:hypothetical protein